MTVKDKEASNVDRPLDCGGLQGGRLYLNDMFDSYWTPGSTAVRRVIL